MSPAALWSCWGWKRAWEGKEQLRFEVLPWQDHSSKVSKGKFLFPFLSYFSGLECSRWIWELRYGFLIQLLGHLMPSFKGELRGERKEKKKKLEGKARCLSWLFTCPRPRTAPTCILCARPTLGAGAGNTEVTNLSRSVFLTTLKVGSVLRPWEERQPSFSCVRYGKRKAIPHGKRCLIDIQRAAQCFIGVLESGVNSN